MTQQVEAEQAEIPSVEQEISPSPVTMADAVQVGMAQPQPEVQAEAPEQPVEVASQPLVINAPTHWPEARRQEFTSLPEAQQQFMIETMRSQDADYTRKTQQLSEYRKTISDFVEKLPAQNQQPDPVVEIPDDPIDRIKYEAREEALEAMREETRNKEATKRITDMELLSNRIKAKTAADPLKSQVQNYLNAVVNGQPEIVCQSDPQQRTYRRMEYDRLNIDPEYYGAMYLKARGVIEQQKPQASEQPVKPTVTTHKPHLERAGVTAPTTPPNPQDEKRQKLVRDIKRGKADSSTLGDYLSSVLG